MMLQPNSPLFEAVILEKGQELDALRFRETELEEKVKRLNARIAQLRKELFRLKEEDALLCQDIIEAMDEAGRTEVSNDEQVIRLELCPPHVVVYNEDALSEMWFRTHREVDKAALLEFLCEHPHATMDGVHLERRQKIVIR